MGFKIRLTTLNMVVQSTIDPKTIMLSDDCGSTRLGPRTDTEQTSLCVAE